MTNLPASIEEAMAVEVAGWLEIVEGKMVFDRDWWIDKLCERLRQSLWRDPIDSDYLHKVINAADKGDEIADAALRRVDAEQREIGEERSKTLAVYGIKAARRGPLKHGRGGDKIKNLRRDYGIAVLVFMITLRFPGLRSSRNATQRREPSACSVLVAAMRLRGLQPPSEATIQNIFLKKQAHLGIYLRDN